MMRAFLDGVRTSKQGQDLCKARAVLLLDYAIYNMWYDDGGTQKGGPSDTHAKNSIVLCFAPLATSCGARPINRLALLFCLVLLLLVCWSCYPR